MAKSKKTYDDDDGRVIASMNVDGMPWYARNLNQTTTEKPDNDFSDLSKGEIWEIIKGTTKAALAVTAVFLLVFLVFIAFCVFVWFR